MKLTSGKEKIVLLGNGKSFFLWDTNLWRSIEYFLTFYITLLKFHLVVFTNF